MTDPTTTLRDLDPITALITRALNRLDTDVTVNHPLPLRPSQPASGAAAADDAWGSTEHRAAM